MKRNGGIWFGDCNAVIAMVHYFQSYITAQPPYAKGMEIHTVNTLDVSLSTVHYITITPQHAKYTMYSMWKSHEKTWKQDTKGQI